MHVWLIDRNRALSHVAEQTRLVMESSFRVRPRAVFYSDWAIPCASEPEQCSGIYEFGLSHENGIEEVARELVRDTYNPVISCAALEALHHHNRKSVIHWLRRELEPFVRYSLTGQESVMSWHRSVVAKWRLFESRFDIELGWIKLDAGVSDGSSSPFSLEGLVYYCIQSAVALSTQFGCSSCRGESSEPCSSNMVASWEESFPWTRKNTVYGFPDYGALSEEQMAAWFLAVSFATFGLLGRVFSDPTVEGYAHLLLQRWHLEMERILMGFVGGGEEPPTYPGGDHDMEI